MSSTHFAIQPIGYVQSELKQLDDAPMQGDEGAPDAWLVLTPQVSQGLSGIHVGDELILLTWLHLADRSVLQVHPHIKPVLAGSASDR
jgi:tRNA (Thr-GGU) A37 N-methylase